MSARILFIMALFVACSARISGQTDLSILGAMTFDLDVYADGEQLNINTPILLKKNLLEEVIDGGGSQEDFLLEFKAEKVVAINNDFELPRRMTDILIIVFVDKVSKEKSEFAINLDNLKIRRSFVDYEAKEVKDYYYSINLSAVPLQLILEAERIDIKVYSSKKQWFRK